MLAPMPVLAVALAVLVQGQGVPDRWRPAKPPAGQKDKLPAFPKHQATWSIRGHVTADAELIPEPKQPANRQELPVFPYTQEQRKLMRAGVLVVVRGLEEKWRFDAPEKPVAMTITEEAFVPRLVAVAPGGVVSVRNPGVRISRLNVRRRDSAMMFSLAKGVDIHVERGKRWNLSFRANRLGHLEAGLGIGELLELEAGARPTASIRLVPHPVFAVTDENGRFSLPKLPAGEYELVATDRRLGKLTQRVKLADKLRGPVRFVFHVPDKLRAKTDK